MIGRRRNVETLRADLEEANALISAHPLASPRIRAAQEVVEDRKPRAAAEVDEELAGKGLPSVEAVGSPGVRVLELVAAPPGEAGTREGDRMQGRAMSTVRRAGFQ